MKIRKGIDEKWKVKPIFINLEHASAYEGPCRLGKGEQLTNDYDKKSGAEKFKVYKQVLSKYPDFVEFINPEYLYCTDSFIYRNSELYDQVKKDLDKADFLLTEGVLSTYPTLLIAKEAGIPAGVTGCCSSDYPAGARNMGLEAYGYIDHEDVKRHFRLLRARKGVRKMKVLYVLQDTVLPFGSVCNIEPSVLTSSLGVDVRFLNAENLFEAVRSITPEQKTEAMEKTRELLGGAKKNTMTEENVQKSVELYVVVKGLLEKYDCNAFSMPCHEVCATRKFNDEFHFTPCLCHSLLKEDGIPSACELDLNVLMAIASLINLTGSAPMMGNTGPFFIPDKLDFSVPNGLPVLPEVVGKENICYTFHAVQTRKMRGITEPNQEYNLQSFTHAGWGATIRHDFNAEIGETITLLRFSPDAKKMMAVKGEIVAGAGIDDIGCATGLYWKCSDIRDFFHKQQNFGHHFAWVYGDWIKDLTEFGELLGVEVITA
jgi:L-fucose isomerase-like protein